MPTSIRLGARAARLLTRLAMRRGETKSDVIRAAIELLARHEEGGQDRANGPTAYDRVAHVVGIADSGGARLSEQTGERFRELLIARARGRRPR